MAWGPDDIAAVEGHPTPLNAITFTTAIPFSGEPSRDCPGVPAAQVYDENTQPQRRALQLHDYMVNVFGRRDQGTGEVRSSSGTASRGGRSTTSASSTAARRSISGAISPPSSWT